MLPICLITALPAEARPLTHYFGLRAVKHSQLRLYQGDCGYLLQCGIGKLNAASSTAAMLELLPEVAAVINAGIAGSDHPIGTSLAAHSVQDHATEQQWFPHLPGIRQLTNIDSVQVVTVDKPQTNYSSTTAFDMEASGIFTAATKVLDLAFIQSLKVVSDNKTHGIENIDKHSVAEHLKNAIPDIELLMNSLPFDTLPSTTEVCAMSESLTGQLHYTTTEAHALKHLLHRYRALFGKLPDADRLADLGMAKSIRQQLQNELDNAHITY